MKDFLNKIILGDCLEVMAQIPNKSIDMILCDLPYGVTARNAWDVIIPFEPLWNQYKRLIKDNAAIVLTATQPFASQLIVSNPKMFRYDTVWVKNKVSGFLNANRMPLRKHESILVFYKKLPVYNPQKTTGHKPVNSFTKHKTSKNYNTETKENYSGGGQTDRFPTSILPISVLNNDSKDRIHPTQKPVELFEYLIKTYTNEGMTVLDNCIGSGTTAIAAIKQKRNFVGIESNENYFNDANKRLETFNPE